MFIYFFYTYLQLGLNKQDFLLCLINFSTFFSLNACTCKLLWLLFNAKSKLIFFYSVQLHNLRFFYRKKTLFHEFRDFLPLINFMCQILHPRHELNSTILYSFKVSQKFYFFALHKLQLIASLSIYKLRLLFYVFSMDVLRK